MLITYYLSTRQTCLVVTLLDWSRDVSSALLWTPKNSTTWRVTDKTHLMLFMISLILNLIRRSTERSNCRNGTFISCLEFLKRNGAVQIE